MRRRRESRLRVAALLVFAACASGPRAGDGGGLGGGGRLEDRVVLGRYAEIAGVAIGRRYVYLATQRGVAVYDRQFDSWLPPLPLAGDLPRGRAVPMAADPMTDAVWIGGFGEVLSWRPDLGALQRTIVPGQVDVILFDSRDYAGGAYVRSAGQWTRVTETGFSSPVDASQLPPAGARVLPETVEQIYQEFPSLRTYQSLLTRDESSLQSWPVSAAARAPDRSEVWLGTWGGGAFQVDPLFNRSTPHPFGLLTDDATAVALAADGVWVVGNAVYGSTRAGLVFASTSLQRWRWLEQPMRSPLLGARPYDLEVRGTRAWVASDRGVMRMDTRSENDVRWWSMTNGLPADVAFAVAPREGGAWAGTARGLVWVSDTSSRRTGRAADVGRNVAGDVAVRALLLTGDTLWVGSDGGLLLVPPVRDPDSARVVRPSAASLEPRLRDPVTAIARSDSIVVVATRDALVRFDLRTGQLLPRMLAVNLAQVGAVTALAVDDRTIWVTGTAGVLVVTRAGDVPRFLRAGTDAVPGPANDVVLEHDWAWLATRDGLVRLRRGADGLPQ